MFKSNGNIERADKDRVAAGLRRKYRGRDCPDYKPAGIIALWNRWGFDRFTCKHSDDCVAIRQGMNCERVWGLFADIVGKRCYGVTTETMLKD